MKKIMLMAAIVCAAVMSYGAAAPWKATITGLYMGNGTDKFSGTVYIMDASLNTMQSVYNAWAQGNDVTGLAAGEIAASNGAAANKTFSYGTPGETFDLYAMVVDGTSKIYFSNLLEDKPGSTSQTATTLAFGAQSGSQTAAKTGFQGAGKWSSATIPEPTSGLLMLIGLAGLALKRKNA